MIGVLFFWVAKPVFEQKTFAVLPELDEKHQNRTKSDELGFRIAGRKTISPVLEITKSTKIAFI